MSDRNTSNTTERAVVSPSGTSLNVNVGVANCTNWFTPTAACANANKPANAKP